MECKNQPCTTCGEASATQGEEEVLTIPLCLTCRTAWMLSMERARALSCVYDFVNRRQSEAHTR